MEMTTEEIPQTQVTEEEKGWLTREEKTAIVEEFEAFQAGGGTIEGFAAVKNMSAATLYRYVRQIRGKKSKGKERANQSEKFKEANSLVASGMSAADACRRVKMTVPAYYYYRSKPSAKVPKKYAPRQVKTLAVVSDDSFNKSLKSRIVVLERLVVELSLDRQALMEAREGAI